MRKNTMTKASMSKMISNKVFNQNKYCKVCGGIFVASDKDERGYNVNPKQEVAQGVHTSCMSKYMESTKEKEEQFNIEDYMKNYTRR